MNLAFQKKALDDTMKYEKEYIETEGKKECFIEVLLKRYATIKKVTATRRYYDCRKKIGEVEHKAIINKEIESKVVINHRETEQPSPLKMFELEDMKRLNCKITKEFLLNYGFTPYQINWLKQEGII